MKVMHDLPFVTHDRISQVQCGTAQFKMQRVVDIAPEPDYEYDESIYRYMPVNMKINEPSKLFSAVKETGFDYFSPTMKYRG